MTIGSRKDTTETSVIHCHILNASVMSFGQLFENEVNYKVSKLRH